jgi:hypothetical protein
VFINTVDANTGYTADVAMGSFICQCANAGYTADAAMHSYICQTQDCSYSSTHFYQHDFLWLPHEYRGSCHEAYGSTLAIGQASGAVSFFSFR